MIVGPKLLLKLVKEEKLVENLDKRELTKPEGAGFDIRVGEIYKLSGTGFLGIKERKTPDAKLVAKYNPRKKSSLTFNPGEQYIVTTFERVNLPEDMTASITMRSTLYRSGMVFSGGNVAPGYSGTLSFTFFNSGNCPIEIELGARVVHIQFSRVEGGGSIYRGQWKGGRVFAKKKEVQV